MKIIICILTGLLIAYAGQAQSQVKEEHRQDTLIRSRRYVIENTTNGPEVRLQRLPQSEGKWSFEGSYGMSFGDHTTISVTPQIRYSRSVYFSVGGGLSYNYYHFSKKGETENMHYPGLNAFARLTPFPYLAFQVQPEIFGRWGKKNGHSVKGRAVPTLLAGGGFLIPAGPGSINLMFYGDIIQNDYSPYGSGLYYTIGYSFSFRYR